MEPLNPLAVARVGLLVASGHARPLPRIYQQHFQTLRFQYLVRSNPIHSGALDRHRLDWAPLEPLGQAKQFRRRGPKIGNLPPASVFRPGAGPVAFAPKVDARPFRAH